MQKKILKTFLASDLIGDLIGEIFTLQEGEVTSPLKGSDPKSASKETLASGVGRALFQSEKNDGRKVARKRKPRRPEFSSSHTPDLNLPPGDAGALVPDGLVSSQVSQLGGVRNNTDGEEVAEEMLKKQKCAIHNNDARSAAAAESSPRRAP
jgi:hypothetical protein